jgi:hypothetical protein
MAIKMLTHVGEKLEQKRSEIKLNTVHLLVCYNITTQTEMNNIKFASANFMMALPQ